MNKLLHQQGTAMVELAILLPLLLLIFFGITELGRALYEQNTLTKTVGVTTRMLTRAYSAIDTESNCATNANWTTAKLDAEQLLKYGDVDGGTELLLNGLALVSVDVTEVSLKDFSKTICNIKVSATSKFQPIISDTLFGFPVIDLTAEAEGRYIGE